MDLTNFSAFALGIIVKHRILELDDISETGLVPVHDKQLLKLREFGDFPEVTQLVCVSRPLIFLTDWILTYRMKLFQEGHNLLTF